MGTPRGNHPGEQTAGVMTIHPTRVQPQEDQTPAGPPTDREVNQDMFTGAQLCAVASAEGRPLVGPTRVNCTAG